MAYVYFHVPSTVKLGLDNTDASAGCSSSDNLTLAAVRGYTPPRYQRWFSLTTNQWRQALTVDVPLTMSDSQGWTVVAIYTCHDDSEEPPDPGTCVCCDAGDKPLYLVLDDVSSVVMVLGD